MAYANCADSADSADPDLSDQGFEYPSDHTVF